LLQLTRCKTERNNLSVAVIRVVERPDKESKSCGNMDREGTKSHPPSTEGNRSKRQHRKYERDCTQLMGQLSNHRLTVLFQSLIV
jgi:hypothetical protein